MTRAIWTAAALSIATFGLTACGEEAPPVEEAPEAPEGITVSDGRLMLPAVKGNPGAVYFEVVNDGDSTRVIRAASVAGAGSAAMHTAEMQEMTQVLVNSGESAKFEPGGQHVMAMDLADTVVAGGKAEVTLTFVGGDKVSFPAEVRAAGDDR